MPTARLNISKTHSNLYGGCETDKKNTFFTKGVLFFCSSFVIILVMLATKGESAGYGRVYRVRFFGKYPIRLRAVIPFVAIM